MEHATFLLVAQCLNQLLHRVPQLIIRIQIYLNERQLSQYYIYKQDKPGKVGNLKKKMLFRISDNIGHKNIFLFFLKY